MEKRRLGRLEHRSSVVIYGGAALSSVAQDEADASISFALDSGINHFDTAADYGDSELRLAPWMLRIRDRIFLSTKTGERDKKAAAASIRRSLDRLQVDNVDLIQLHAVGDVAELDKATRSGGAVEAALEARAEGLVKAIGITGHGMKAPATHLEALRRFSFDTVLTPFNYRLSRIADYRRDFEALVEEAMAQDVGLMIIKHVARNLWRDDEEPEYTTWYRPLDEQSAIDAAVAFVLARTEVTGICAPSDVRLLPHVVEAESKRHAADAEAIRRTLESVGSYESPFLPSPGRSIPEGI